MGQTYFATAEIHPKDEPAFIAFFKDYIQEKISKGVGFDCKGKAITSLDDCMAYIFTSNVEKKDGIYTASFNATYSWDDFMYETFIRLTEFLKDGSWFKYYPDHGRVYRVLCGGEWKQRRKRI